MTQGIRYARDLLSSAKSHVTRGEYDVASFEARQAALSALSAVAASGSGGVREAYERAIASGLPRDPSLLLCAALLDSLELVNLERCEDACVDELPAAEALSWSDLEDATRAVGCAERLLEHVTRYLGTRSAQ
ncbi:MAG: HEPN domain-containing protein [Acidilobus sp.]